MCRTCAVSERPRGRERLEELAEVSESTTQEGTQRRSYDQSVGDVTKAFAKNAETDDNGSDVGSSSSDHEGSDTNALLFMFGSNEFNQDFSVGVELAIRKFDNGAFALRACCTTSIFAEHLFLVTNLHVEAFVRGRGHQLVQVERSPNTKVK